MTAETMDNLYRLSHLIWRIRLGQGGGGVEAIDWSAPRPSPQKSQEAKLSLSSGVSCTFDFPWSLNFLYSALS